jgi:hypothetical protein
MSKMPWSVPLPALLLVLVSAAGCSGMGKFDVVVKLDESFRAEGATVPSIEVDLIGVNAVEYPRWENYSMSQYWSPADQLRRDADKYVMRFGQDWALAQTLRHQDAVWRRWKPKQATHLFVLAFLPGVHEDQPGNADPRRLILPLDQRRWPRYGWWYLLWRNRRIELLVKSSEISCLTPPKPADR